MFVGVRVKSPITVGVTVKVCAELLPAVNVTVVVVSEPSAEPPKVIVTTVVDSTYALGVRVKEVDAVLTAPVVGPVNV